MVNDSVGGVPSQITIDGTMPAGDAGVTIAAAGTNPMRVFAVGDGDTLSLNYLTITGGKARAARETTRRTAAAAAAARAWAGPSTPPAPARAWTCSAAC